MPPDAGLIARVSDVLTTLGERSVRQKRVFSGHGFLLGKTTFAIVWDDSLIVKAARSEHGPLLREPGVTPFAPGGERPMGTWLVVAAEEIADDPELTDWLRRALRGIR
jgi:TfoX/Sxy family transcriptional regulator of competence genes